MPEAALGLLLRNLRESRGLSYREVAQLADLDHAYIYRLESGDKESPSAEAVEKLIRALKPGRRDSEMLRFLAMHAETAPALVALAISDPSISSEVFAAAAGASFRTTGRPDYEKLVGRIRRILDEENDDG